LWLPRSRSSTLNLSPSIQFGSSKGETAYGGLSCEVKNDWLSTIRGRFGYAAGHFMPYVTGGGAFDDINTSVSGIGSANETKAVWTVGGGVETALSGPWSAKLKYLYGRPRARRHDCWRGRQVRNQYRARRSQLPVF
jgi:opacity protein-like surface antigen